MSKTFLITGGHGFLGAELTRVLSERFSTHTLGRSKSNDIVVDLANSIPSFSSSFDIVVHNAGKAHVIPQSTEEINDFYKVNHQGTLNLLRGLELCESLPKALVLISSVAVYGLEYGSLLDEETPLQAKDPYGESKIFAEKSVLEWGKKNNVLVSILRLPIVVGSQPLGNLQAMIKAVRKGYYFQIGKDDVNRSMVLSHDVAKIIPVVAENGGVFNLTDGTHPTFRELGLVLAEKFESPNPKKLPLWLGKSLAKTGDLGSKISNKEMPFNSRKLQKMTSSLTFSDNKARKVLGWNPGSVLGYLTNVSKTELVNV